MNTGKHTIEPRFTTLIAISFILVTVVGTLSHEFGHVLAARLLGYRAFLHYSSVTTNIGESYRELSQRYPEAAAGMNQDQRENYNAELKRLKRHSLWIRSGGPFQTIVTGSIGVFILLLGRKRGWAFIDWVAVFLALFWLRQVFNLVVSIGTERLFPDGSYFGGDEYSISLSLNLPPGTFSVILGVLGLLVSSWVIFFRLPSRFRPSFILGGFAGGMAGYVLWMIILGPLLLP